MTALADVPRSLVDVLRAAAVHRPGGDLHVFPGRREVERLSYDELYDQAGRIACGLLDRGVTRGERIALALPTSADFLCAFFGVLAAGAVPVPVPPPFRFASLEIHMRRISLSLRQSKVRRILSNPSLAGLLAPAIGELDQLEILAIDQVRASSPVFVDPAASDPALIQYTSGSVAAPKGVVLSHGNLLANLEAITRALGFTADDTVCSWLPLFHDMGLIGCFLGAVYNRAGLVLMSPEGFLRDPAHWLGLFGRFRGTLAPAPSSAYAHCVKRVSADDARGLDLSSWRSAMNGAENVDPETARRFAHHFAGAGFHAEAITPVYGLAEASLAVTFTPSGRGLRTIWAQRDRLTGGPAVFSAPHADGARELASVGVPVHGTEVRIVDQGQVLPDGSVGEVMVRSPSVMQGYEDSPAATRDALHGDWLSTGDLGFVQDGELFIAGRKKEMVIVLGQNYYASDIESIASQVPGVSAHDVMAASVAHDDGESLSLFIETRERQPERREALATQVREAISMTLGVTPRDIVLVDRGTIPRTSSGKIQRHRVAGFRDDHTQCSTDKELKLT